MLDPFCGSGTALLAAKLFGRRWLGIDANPEAVELARRRLTDAHAPLIDNDDGETT